MEHRNSKLSYNHRNNHNKHSRSSNSSRNSIINYCFNSNNNNNNCNQSYSNLLNNLVECSISNQMANSHSFPWHTHSSNKSQIFLRTYNNRCKNQLKWFNWLDNSSNNNNSNSSSKVKSKHYNSSLHNSDSKKKPNISPLHQTKRNPISHILL